MSIQKVNIASVEQEAAENGDRFEIRRRRVGRAVGHQQLGVSQYELHPGKTLYPYHYHFQNEEGLYVLEGSPTLRTPDGDMALSTGDYVSFLPGPGGAHQLRNDSDSVCKVLMVSTMFDPDTAFYPDSKKFGMFSQQHESGIFPEGARVNYWEGEDS